MIIIFKFKNEEETIIHRVISIGEKIITKGDANSESDEPISYTDIKEIYFLKIPSATIFPEKTILFLQKSVINFPLGSYFVMALLLYLVVKKNEPHD